MSSAAPPPKPASRAIALAVAVAGCAAVTGLVQATDETYEDVQSGHGVAAFDQPVLDWMVAHRSPGLDAAATWLTNLGGKVGMPIIALIVVVILARRWRTWAPIVVMAVATAGSVVMTTLGKQLSDRARPPHDEAVPPYESSPSFPSGHSLNSMVIAVIVIYLCWAYGRSLLSRTAATVAALAFTLAIGASRVFLGLHWTTDVLAGWAVGAAWALVVILCHRLLLVLLRRRERHEQQQAAPADG